MPGHTYCCVVGCNNNSKQDPDMMFFRVPMEWDRLIQWAKLIGRLDLLAKKNPANSRVCAVHFEPSMFVVKRLIANAIPTLFLPERPNSPDNITVKQEDTDSNQADIDLPPISPRQQNETLIKPTDGCDPTLFKISSRIVFEGDLLEGKSIESTIKTEPELLDAQNLLESHDEHSKIHRSSETDGRDSSPLIEWESRLIKTEPDFLEDLEIFDAFSAEFTQNMLKKEPGSDTDVSNSDNLNFEEPEPMTSIKNTVKVTSTYSRKRKHENNEKNLIISPYDLKNKAGSSKPSPLGLIEHDKLPKISVIETTTDFDKNQTGKPFAIKDSKINDVNKKDFVLKQDRMKPILTNKNTLQIKRNLVNIKLTDLVTVQPDITEIRNLTDALRVAMTMNDRLLKFIEQCHTKYDGKLTELEFQLLFYNLKIRNPLLFNFLQNSMSKPVTIKAQKCFKPGDIDEIIEVLSQKLDNGSLNYRYCMLCMKLMPFKWNLCYDVHTDEIVGLTEVDGVKSNEMATDALIVSVRGCIDDYHQPIGYAFTGKAECFAEINNWLIKIINKLTAAGFMVCALVSDESKLFCNLAEYMGVNEGQSYFEVDNQKIYYIFDARHAIKDFYNTLRSCNFLYDQGKLASWKYIEAFYNWDKDRALKLAPQLTSLHLKPELGKKPNEVFYALELLSYTVAAGMTAAIEIGHLDSEAQETVAFIMKLVRVLDVLSSDKGSKVDHLKRPFTGSTLQNECLHDALALFKYMQVYNVETKEWVTASVNGILAIRLTMKSILHLYPFFISRFIKEFATKVFSVDLLEKFVLEIQEHTKTTMTPASLRRSFTKLVSEALLRVPEGDKNVMDMQHLIGSDVETIKANLFFKSRAVECVPALNVDAKEYISELPIKKVSFKEACFFVLNACLLSHDCVELRKHVQAGGRHGTASTEFVNYVSLFEYMFAKEFESVLLLEGVGAKLLEKLEVLKDKEKPCPCFPVTHFIKIYLRMRIRHILKRKNYTQRWKLDEGPSVKVTPL